MNTLFASFEMSPLAKVGGLGDVAGSLPRALRARGADVRVAMPMHGAIDRKKLDAEHVLTGVNVPWASGEQRVDVWYTKVRGVPVYLVQNEHYFERPNVYGYDDDRDRTLFFCDALLASAHHLGFRPDVVHAQDWHAAMLLSRLSAMAHPWDAAGRVYTIHNLALKGTFDAGFARHYGIGAEQLTPPAGLPPEIALSGMAQGILHADKINTVSDTYAREILTPEYGAGLDPLLRARAADLTGIVNGIDYEEFNPATDPALAQRFDVDSLGARIENKRALQREMGLPVQDEVPLFGVVTRLFAQKGIDLVAEAFQWLLHDRPAQLVVLGTGDQVVHDQLTRLQERYPRQVRVRIDFDPPLGQRIYGGCDCFLMPSRYEPCGLGQLISLRYGAVPLVRRTGGLADTVEDAGATLRTGTGFVFDDASADALRRCAERAIDAYADAAGWRAMQERGMRQDWSWDRAAGKYLDLYGEALEARTGELEREATA
ncbi:MAG: glycogen synthase [Dehalococcoidia bacterium]